MSTHQLSQGWSVFSLSLCILNVYSFTGQAVQHQQLFKC